MFSRKWEQTAEEARRRLEQARGKLARSSAWKRSVREALRQGGLRIFQIHSRREGLVAISARPGKAPPDKCLVRVKQIFENRRIEMKTDGPRLIWFLGACRR
jgi:hypothetical protein